MNQLEAINCLSNLELKELDKAIHSLRRASDDYPEMDGYPQTIPDQQKICSDILVKHGGSTSLLPYMLIILKVLMNLYNAN